VARLRRAAYAIAPMYATCLFCTRPLGRNETVEAFPVGRRLAFDARRGRLWVVCAACRGWNLTPLEERWDAIEACERLFRGTRTRVSTDHVGLARVGDGLELVRIGEPLRPEFAAWRYGDRFASRRRRAMVRRTANSAIGFTAVGIVHGVTVLAGGAVISAAIAAGIGATGIGVLAGLAMSPLGEGAELFGRRVMDRTRVALRGDGGELLRVREQDVARTALLARGGELALRVGHREGEATLVGATARDALAKLLPLVNDRSGTGDDVRRAVARIDHAGGAEAFLDGIAERGPRWTRVPAPNERLGPYGDFTSEPPPDSGLRGLAPSVALAIEMAAHEETERRALEGELAQLEQAWRDAEEIGRIADDLLLPERVARALHRIRGR